MMAYTIGLKAAWRGCVMNVAEKVGAKEGMHLTSRFCMDFF
jgi:hypothetical protein